MPAFAQTFQRYSKIDSETLGNEASKRKLLRSRSAALKQKVVAEFVSETLERGSKQQIVYVYNKTSSERPGKSSS